MTQQVAIHCKPSYLDSLQQLKIRLVNYEYEAGEVTAIVDNNSNLNDVELCKHYGIDYDFVNDIELI
tara:strand:+ start:516 stop:716 length:201 start_codon:yes stop_codon:yes gene_type:complete